MSKYSTEKKRGATRCEKRQIHITLHRYIPYIYTISNRIDINNIQISFQERNCIQKSSKKWHPEIMCWVERNVSFCFVLFFLLVLRSEIYHSFDFKIKTSVEIKDFPLRSRAQCPTYRKGARFRSQGWVKLRCFSGRFRGPAFTKKASRCFALLLIQFWERACRFVKIHVVAAFQKPGRLADPGR